MNIVYLHSHDTGRAISPYGYAARTPALQRLAEEGVLFRQAFCVAPTCSPSRAGLLTGQCAHAAGMVALAHRGGRLKHPERHLAHVLREAGYTTVMAGVSHLAPGPRDCGYVRIRDEESKEQGIDEFATAFLRERPAEPFFLDVGFFDTHRTGFRDGFSQAHHSPTDGEGDDRYVMPPAVFPDTPETRRDWRDYLNSLERLDRAYAQVLAALEESGLADNTLVIATTDHGPAFPDMKCQLTHHGTGVLLILRGPGGFRGGRVVDALTSHLDVFPTICALAGIEAPPWLEGRDLGPLARGETTEGHDALFSEVTFHAGFEPKRAVRTRRWNYVRNFGPLRHVRPNTDAGLTKTLWNAHGWPDQPVAREELYDLMFDPQERANLAASPAHAEVLAAMRGTLKDWMTRTDDPILHDDAAALPPRLIVNPPEQTDPADEGKREWNRAEWAGLDRSW